ncbi:epoxide hydrolase [Paenibacillus glucanolyticus]|jgi:pimeloyl-ACP methyl ester carboxylesterase|uniref:epoxide hydrolase family protein n=1 Tax=Paenibacillus TaxID=44249 RepID=UPI0003E29FA9|nr:MULTISPECIES: epoxide hydrolase [Paenibacillus]AVV58411.1 epoxide hydrolase [Paenibacillus glucanolyticus]ETT40292.1 hydrolase [Paenibacillus sp. FSL R5-808]MCA4750913.1 epoxide hydrolase N-terminal domain-containing protein [Mycolicibacterium fortuitum]MPY20293.1 epoxide hydrolase 1 [Paenibacillus glucanolyticus]
MSQSKQELEGKGAIPNEIRPFRIEIPQADLDDLRERLVRTRWPAQLPGGKWKLGIPVAYLKNLTEYWKNDYNWREYEAKLNEFPQFITEIDGQTIHFLHVRSPEPNALPLIITHSWPNSVVEFMNIIGPLTNPRAHGTDPDKAFHVVAPSIPGFGFSQFSEPADESTWNIVRVARTWAELMRRLGYDRYGAHGNDAGALVSPELAVIDSEHVIGVHITSGLGIPTGDPEELEDLTEEDRAELEHMVELLVDGSGYASYLTHRPQTLSYGWNDSPVAQLAYLVERFKEFDGWPGTGFEAPNEPIDQDQLLTNATLYWLTRTAGSSSWTYYEGAAGMPIDQTKVPTGVSHGGSPVFRRLAERKNNIVHWSYNTSGSHMVAMAAPESLVVDIRDFFSKLR